MRRFAVAGPAAAFLIRIDIDQSHDTNDNFRLFWRLRNSMRKDPS